MSPSKEPKNLMDEDKKDTPPAEAVPWSVSCNERTRTSREEAGTISRSVTIVVSARTWIEAKELAFRTFASDYHIYEPEDVKAHVLTSVVGASASPETSVATNGVDAAAMNVIKKDRRAKKKKAEAAPAPTTDTKETP